MTLFDQVLINLHKGFEKVKQNAAVFSERLKAELNIVRLRIRMNSIQAEIDGLHRLIGKKAAGLRDKEERPKSFEEFLNYDEIAHAIEEIEKRKKELEDILAGLAGEQSSLKPEVKEGEETAV